MSLKELKDEVNRLRYDINRISEALIEHRLDSVERAIASKHMRLYVNQTSNYLEDSVNSCINVECSKNKECMTKFNEEVNVVFNLVETQSIEETLTGIKEKLVKIQAIINEVESGSCKVCYTNLRDLIAGHQLNLKQITGHEPKDMPHKIQVDLLIDKILKPLSHPARLMIFITLGTGSLGFSELSNLTDMRGGHLLFHLDQLTDAGLVIQDGRKGNYAITSQGLEIMQKLRSLSLAI